MKLVHRLSIGLPLLTSVGYAQASNWTNLTSARDVAYAVDTDSISKDALGYIEYVTRTTWKTPAPLPGARGSGAGSSLRFVVDCGEKSGGSAREPPTRGRRLTAGRP